MKKCSLSNNKNRPFFEIPVNPKTRSQWLDFLASCNITDIKDHTVLCKIHFEDSCFNEHLKLCRLKPDAVPTRLTQVVNHVENEVSERNSACCCSQPPVDFFKKEMQHLGEKCKYLTVKLRQETQKHRRCLYKLQNLEQRTKKYSKVMKCIEAIISDAEYCDDKAMCLLDSILRYNKRKS